jgi:ABC-type dipeptide/oligopeptide/nickel transport system ATPase component
MSSDLIICQSGPTLPQETIVSKVGIVGMSGSGKTQTARKFAESMLEIDQHIAVLDPTGAWWGLRSSADGLSEGYAIVVFGGRHADAPLTPDSGTMLAKALLRERFNAIFDMSMFNDAQVRQFSTDFLNEVNLHNQHPLHIFLDEFDIICPQAKGANSEESRAACNTTVRRTRIKGIGVTMITQNPQDADKSVLNMADTVIAMRTQGSQAVDAIKKWMGRNLSAERVAELSASLPELTTGHGWIWAPQARVFEVAHFLLCKTFDSSKTPKLGETILPPKVLAPIDIAHLGKAIAQSVEKAKEEDPKFLQQRIRELEEQVAKGGKQDMGLSEDIAAMEAELAELRPLQAKMEELQTRLFSFGSALAQVGSAVSIAQERLNELLGGDSPQHLGDTALLPPLAAGSVERATPRDTFTPTAPRAARPSTDGEAPGRGEQKVLDALASLHAVGVMSPSKTQIAHFAGYSNPKSGGFSEPMATLVRNGWATSSSGSATLTPEGMRLAKQHLRPATSKELQAKVMEMLGVGESKLLTILIRVYPKPVRRADLAAEAGYSNPKSGGFSEPVSRLIDLGLAESPAPGMVRGSDILFVGGRR